MSIRTLVIDDEFPEREQLYRNLAKSRYVKDSLDLQVAPHHPFEVDAIAEASRQCQIALVDIFLEKSSHQPFEISQRNILDVLESANPKLPIYLVSSRWNDLNLPILDRLLRRKRVVGGITLEMLNDISECARLRYEIRTAVRDAWGIAHSNLAPDDELLILHISDLQFGGPWVSGDGALVEGDNLITSIFDTMPTASDGRPLVPDVLAVTGDLAQQGEPKEFWAALRFLKKLRSKLGIRKESCFIIPGNHDVSLPLASSHLIQYSFSKPFGLLGDQNPQLVGTSNTRGLDRFGLAPFQDFCRMFTERDDWTLELQSDGEPTTSNWFSCGIFVPFGVNIIGLNTVALLGPEAPSRAALSGPTVNSVADSLDIFREQGPQAKQAIHLVLLHHSPWQGVGDSTLGHDGSNLLTQLSKRGDCIFLFGHIHQALANVRTYTDHSNRQALFATSSTLSLAARARPEDSLRSFNIIILERKDDMVHGARVQRFEFRGHEYSRADEKAFDLDSQQGWIHRPKFSTKAL